MKTYRTLLLLVLLLTSFVTADAKPMKARTIQPLFAKDARGLADSFQWTLDELEKCDASLDIVVLPEFSEVPGSTPNNEFLNYVKKYGPALLEACSKTAARCSTLVFCGAIDMTEHGPRNTIFVYDRQGKLIGKYLKEHLTRGEWANLGFDKSYTQEWNTPYILEIEGLKYAFLTCYDFYFYENYSNIARFNPDIIIGSSHQRSDTHRALDLIDAFCAYNTGAYLVRASVSMGEDSPLGGCSCVVAPTGEILGNLASRVSSLDVTFDPEAKYLKPAGFGNPPAKHCQYIEIGRRPWKYRPGGSAIALPLREAAEKRLCAMKGYADIADESLLAAYGAAVALGAAEIGYTVSDKLSLWELEAVLKKLSCHCLMNIRLDNSAAELTGELCAMINNFDARDYVYFSSADPAVLEKLASEAPDIERCFILGKLTIDDALKCGCTMVCTDGKDFEKSFADEIHAKGLRCCVYCYGSRGLAKAALGEGADTILTDDWYYVSEAIGLK